MGYNEGWGQPDDPFATAAVTAKVRGIDPTRLIDSITGINLESPSPRVDIGVGDAIDLHHYSDPGALKYKDFRFSVLGEYGGSGLYVQNHSWALERCHGYGHAKADAEELVHTIEKQQQMVLSLAGGEKSISASVY